MQDSEVSNKKRYAWYRCDIYRRKIPNSIDGYQSYLYTSPCSYGFSLICNLSHSSVFSTHTNSLTCLQDLPTTNRITSCAKCHACHRRERSGAWHLASSQAVHRVLVDSFYVNLSSHFSMKCANKKNYSLKSESLVKGLFLYSFYNTISHLLCECKPRLSLLCQWI